MFNIDGEKIVVPTYTVNNKMGSVVMGYKPKEELKGTPKPVKNKGGRPKKVIPEVNTEVIDE